MKNLIAFIAFVCMTSFTAFGQGDFNSISNNQGSAMAKMADGLVSSYGSSVHVTNPRRRVVGTFYLYENWENLAVIHTSDNQRFSLRNINLNIKRHTFESKVAGDSIFTFNFNNIDKFIVNGRVYKNFYWDDDSKVYEVIYEGNNLQLLKGFKVQLVEGSANPMLNRSVDRYIRKEYYYVREDDKIRKFKLKQSKVLKLVNGDEAAASKIIAYAKNNRLSFKKEDDVKKILEYSAKN